MTGIKPRTTRVVIYQGDDIDRLLGLDLAVERAEAAAKVADAADVLMHEDSPATALIDAKAERDQFAAEAEERGVAVVLTARPRLRWRELMRDHGPREDNDDDRVFGVNMETLPDVLLPESVDAEESTIEGDVGEFLDSLSDHDYYDRLFVAAFALNRGSAPADPTRRLLSGSSQTSDATSS